MNTKKHHYISLRKTSSHDVTGGVCKTKENSPYHSDVRLLAILLHILELQRISELRHIL